MSIGELESLYGRDELDIHPKFQRILRWSDAQKTKLIESLLLRIPIPPIFVAQDPSGRWDVVDGVQRLGTIFEFLGVLRRPDGSLHEPLSLVATKLLPSLNSYRFRTATKIFSSAQQLDFRRLRLDVQVILKESDPSTKYELFERLNTGGSIASDQEVRNCVLVWINEPLFDWMHDTLSENVDFREAIPLSDRLEEQQYRLELVLRFLVLHDMAPAQLRRVTDLGDFLNEQNRRIAISTDFDRAEQEQLFGKTFRVLNRAIGPDAFRKFDVESNQFKGGFLISAFEAIALGVAHNIARWSRPGTSGRLQSLIKSAWSQPAFREHIGIGVPARERIQHSIPFGREHFGR